MLIAFMLLGQSVPPCTGIDVNLPREAVGWIGEPAMPMTPGRPVLVPTTDAQPPPSSPTLSDLQLAGRFARIAFTITKAGRYRIALSPGYPTIDLARVGGREMTADERQKDWGSTCSTIAQMESFDLRPGRYDLQISGVDRREIKVMLIAALTCALPTSSSDGIAGDGPIACPAER